MKRVIGWWLLVSLLIIAPGLMRYHARNAYAVEEKDDTVVESARTFLSSRNFIIVDEIQDPDRNNRLIGFRFRDQTCTNEMSVIAFNISYVAEAFVLDFASQNDTYEFHYYDHEYRSSSRLTLMALWVKSLVSSRLNLGADTHSKLQLAVVWPKNCSKPTIDWSRVWEQQTHEAVKS